MKRTKRWAWNTLRSIDWRNRNSFCAIYASRGRHGCYQRHKWQRNKLTVVIVYLAINRKQRRQRRRWYIRLLQPEIPKSLKLHNNLSCNYLSWQCCGAQIIRSVTHKEIWNLYSHKKWKHSELPSEVKTRKKLLWFYLYRSTRGGAACRLNSVLFCVGKRHGKPHCGGVVLLFLLLLPPLTLVLPVVDLRTCRRSAQKSISGIVQKILNML